MIVSRVKRASVVSCTICWAFAAPALLAACSSEQGESDVSVVAELGSVAQEYGSSPGIVTSIKPYVAPVSPEYSIQPLLSVGDRVPRTSNPTEQFQMVGIPDGMGLYRAESDSYVVYMNHEFGNTTTSEPIVGQPLNRGAIVSTLILDAEGRVKSADRAYATVWDENTLVGPAADVTNTTAGFARFCSGSLSWKEAGFDRPIYLAGEESGGAGTFDGMGGLGIAIFDNELHTLPKFGRFPWENTLAQPKKPHGKTVLMGMEDGPTTPDNQLYLYVGKKERKVGSTPMRRNGLDNGLMYAFVSDTPGKTTELEFTEGSIEGHFEVIPSPEDLSDVQLEAAADAIGAFGFIRTEDGAFDPKNPDIFYFVTTGSGSGNQLGRMYKMTLNGADPTGHATIEMIYNADQLAAQGIDSPISPDNIGVSKDYVMINEDGTTPSRARLETLGREASIWRVLRSDLSMKRIAELNPPGRDAIDVPTSGTWETTGIVEIPGLGKDAWLVNVQAHGPTTAPAANTVEDGQLLLMRRTNVDALTSVE